MTPGRSRTPGRRDKNEFTLNHSQFAVARGGNGCAGISDISANETNSTFRSNIRPKPDSFADQSSDYIRNIQEYVAKLRSTTNQIKDSEERYSTAYRGILQQIVRTRAEINTFDLESLTLEISHLRETISKYESGQSASAETPKPTFHDSVARVRADIRKIDLESAILHSKLYFSVTRP